jgi:hypothetical protein
MVDHSPAAMALQPKVLEEMEAAVERANRHLSRVEQIKRFKVLAGDWPPAGDELTPTMKLKAPAAPQRCAAPPASPATVPVGPAPNAEKHAAEIEARYRA